MANYNREKQNANLIKFTEKTAREMGARGGHKKKENEPKRKAHEEIKKQIIEETYGQIYDRLMQGLLSNSELLNLFGSTIKISGDLIQKQEIAGGIDVQKVFIDKETKEEANKHIDDFINGD